MKTTSDTHAIFALMALALITALTALPACTNTTVLPTVTVTETHISTTTATTPPPTSQTTTTSHPTTTTTTSTLPPTSTPPSSVSLENGEDIFQSAYDIDGVHIQANGFVMMGFWLACAHCHGEDGHGGTVYMMMAQYDVPNITWPELTGPDYNPPYTADTLKRAITQGLDEEGMSLDPFMPRWVMSDRDLGDLVSYIQTLT